jgi:predicted house-cleaning noncanonical NTP pyrophosphatase (MazG superfamily)
MPSTPQRGFIVRPTLDNTEPEAEPVPSRTVEERIKDKMLEKIEEFLESNQLNELSVLAAVYQQFKELHP